MQQPVEADQNGAGHCHQNGGAKNGNIKLVYVLTLGEGVQHYGNELALNQQARPASGLLTCCHHDCFW